MIIRKRDVPSDRGEEGQAEEYGAFESLRYSDAGGISQYGAYVVTLEPGSRSSDRHWHENEDEFLYVLSGVVTVIENDGAHTLQVGDAACWPAGAANGHCVENRSSAPCSYFIVGTRVSHDVCHYPDSGKILYTEGESWRITDAVGRFIKGGSLR